MYNVFGVIVGNVQITLPFMVLSLIGVIRDIHPSFEEAARSLGASRWRAFRRDHSAAYDAGHSRAACCWCSRSPAAAMWWRR